MNKLFLLILVFSLSACEKPEPEIKNLRVKSPLINAPVAMDANFNSALCDHNGYAIDLARNVTSHRVVDGEFVKCMDKATFLDYLSSEGEDISRFENMIAQYPEFDTVKPVVDHASKHSPNSGL